MALISKQQLDGQFRSELTTEFTPVYEGGILSSANAALPHQDGAVMLANVDSAVHVKFKTTNLTSSNQPALWVYISYSLSAAHAGNLRFETYYQKTTLGSNSDPTVGPTGDTITPTNSTVLQTTRGQVVNGVLAWKVPAIQKESFIRFEIVRKGSDVLDTNTSDLYIHDVNFTVIPNVQVLTSIDSTYPATQVIPLGSNKLSAKGDLLSHDGTSDTRLLYGGVGKALISGSANSTGVQWGLSFGVDSAAAKSSEFSHSAGKFAAAGDAQYGRCILRNTTTNATITELFIDGSSERFTVAEKEAYLIELKVAASKDDLTQVGVFTVFNCLIKRSLSGSVIVVNGVSSATPDQEIGSPPWVLDVDADTSNQSLRIRVTGAAGTTVRWVATLEYTKVSH